MTSRGFFLRVVRAPVEEARVGHSVSFHRTEDTADWYRSAAMGDVLGLLEHTAERIGSRREDKRSLPWGAAGKLLGSKIHRRQRN